MFIGMQNQVTKFLKTCKSAKTAACYEPILRRLADWLSSRSLQFHQLTPALFEAWLNEIPSWKAVSRYLAYNVARSFLRWCIGEDHPLSGMKWKRPKAKPQPTITQEQFNRLMEFFNTMSPIGARDLALFALMAETGLRATAVCNLKMRDLYMDSLSLVALDKGRNGGEWRVCKFSPLVASYLAAWLAHRPGIALPNTETVFCSVRGVKRGLPQDRFGLLSRCREISKKVCFNFTPHFFRRFMATRMLELKAPDRAVMKQGGWVDEREFRKYVQTYQVQDVESFSPVVDYYKKGGKTT